MTAKLNRNEYDEVMNWRAQRLIEAGEMPSFEEIEAAVRKAQEELQTKLKEQRKTKR